jgi:hypothetical protein
MGRVICLTPAAMSLHSGQVSSVVDNAQELNVAQSEQGPERDHAYLRLEERPTLRTIALGAEPNPEAGAIIYDAGAWVAYPHEGEPFGPFIALDDAQLALRIVRIVAALAGFFAWLGAGSGHAPPRGDNRKADSAVQPGKSSPASRPRGGA